MDKLEYFKLCLYQNEFKTVTDVLNLVLEYVSTTVIIIITCALTLLYLWMRRKQTAFVQASSSFVKLRFRKREKIWFYGRKMLRRVKLLAKPNTLDQVNYIKSKVSRKKKMMVNIAGSFFRNKKNQEKEIWKSREPPSSLLEVDTQDLEPDHSLPSELIYMLRNVRVLGHFEKPIFLELCRYMESRSVSKGSYLFQVGDPDDAIYVVQSGRVLVHITEPDGKEFCVKEVNQGESVHSLLSVMDTLTGHSSPYKTVSAIATENSSILRLPTAAFEKVLAQYPESLVRVVQIIMIRLQRVTFLALHNYLGLSQELINHEPPFEKSLLIHSSISKPHVSPAHKFSRSYSKEEYRWGHLHRTPGKAATSQQALSRLVQTPKGTPQTRPPAHLVRKCSQVKQRHSTTCCDDLSSSYEPPDTISKAVQRTSISGASNLSTTSNQTTTSDQTTTSNLMPAKNLVTSIIKSYDNSITTSTSLPVESEITDKPTKSSLKKGLRINLDLNKGKAVEPSDFITACTRARVEPETVINEKSEEHKRARSHSPVTSPYKSSLFSRHRKKSVEFKKIAGHLSRHHHHQQSSHHHQQSSHHHQQSSHHHQQSSHHHQNYHHHHNNKESPVHQQPQHYYFDTQQQQRQRHRQFLLQDQNHFFNNIYHDQRQPQQLQLHSQQHLIPYHQQPHTPLYHHLDTYNCPYNPVADGVPSSQLFDLALQDLANVLGLSDVSMLKDKCLLRSVRANTMLVKQGDQDCSLYFMVSGWLKVLQQVVGKETENKTMYEVDPGELVGTLAVLTGEPSFFSIQAVTDVKFVHIAKNDFYILMKKQPSIVLNAGHTVVSRMSAFVRQIDFGLDWILIESGRALYRQSERSDCVYIILNGRLRSVIQLESGKKELVGEYGRGELVGLVEVLTQTDRSTTMMAVRDTELAQIPDEMLNLIKRKHPQVVTRLIHLLGQRILGSLGNQSTVYGTLSEQIDIESKCTVGNLATVAVMAVNEKVPLMTFTLELQHSLNAIGSTLRLNSDFVQSKLGKSAFDPVNEFRLSSWLGQQEDVHRMVFYECDTTMSPWTQRCIRQSDCILLVSLADQDPSVGKLEKQLESMSVRAQKELILLHKQDSPLTKNTLDWLNIRPWCSGHHHIRCPKRIFSRKPYSKIMEMYKELMQQGPEYRSDFSRLARFLTGTSIGVVLGGGGARGCSHVGVVKALTEADIPIDIIGGTSIGSFMGALWAQETKFTPFKQRAREFAKGMTSLWKKIFDLTYPVTAMFTGSFLNKEIESVFQDCQIEDLWIPYYCITTDITASKMRVHTHGSLWRYVRASMSLSGYLPPLCDPHDGHLLLDGGYVNNLPADIMKVMGAQTIFAIDVGSQDETNLTNYGDELSGWWLLWKRFNPWAEQVKVPNMADIQSRLAYVSCNRQMEQVKSSNYCEYIRPPIDKYRNLQFGSYDEIAEVGYNHAKLLFSEWQKTDRIRSIFLERSEQNKPPLDKNTVPAGANFTDLAELISRIEEPEINPASFISPVNHLPDTYSSDTEEENVDNMSVTSEPIVSSPISPTLHARIRCGSEGATPEGNSDLSQNEDDYEDEDDLINHRLDAIDRYAHVDF